MIVKIQAPLASNEAEPPAMVYTEDREWSGLVPFTEELQFALGGRPKAYFHATVDKGAVEIALVIGEEVHGLEW